MAVGASKPTVVADKDGFFSVKSKMLVSEISILLSFSV
jgi:pyruvate dehydrogenase E2 component (dihydrolipoamide acetyltransferase)